MSDEFAPPTSRSLSPVAPNVDEVSWNPWTPDVAAAAIGVTTIPWCVTAGWAIDLFLGQTTRAHDDIEIAAPRARWRELHGRLATLEFFVAGSGELFPLTDRALDEHFQTWGRDVDGVFRVDVFRDPHDGDTWICRRDPRLRLPYRRVISVTPTGVPYMNPEIVLLFKAKHDREKDRRDLQVALPRMSEAQIDWLRESLAMTHPDHAWQATLAAPMGERC